MKVFFADSDAFDNSRTGYYASETDAMAAWWAENTLTEAESARAHPYIREAEDEEDTRQQAAELALDGSPSPALARR